MIDWAPTLHWGNCASPVGADGEQDGLRLGEAGQGLPLAADDQALARVLCCHRALVPLPVCPNHKPSAQSSKHTTGASYPDRRRVTVRSVLGLTPVSCLCRQKKCNCQAHPCRHRLPDLHDIEDIRTNSLRTSVTLGMAVSSSIVLWKRASEDIV